MNKLYNFPLKTFNPDTLLEEMLNAKDGDMFVLGERSIAQQLGDNSVELTIAQIKKVRDEPTKVAGQLATDLLQGDGSERLPLT